MLMDVWSLNNMKVFYIDNQKVSVQYVKILGIEGFYMGIISRHIPSQYLWGT
jgi:alpha-D-ribose 1-methylphosphonate 5-phosphate C-P lyase